MGGQGKIQVALEYCHRKEDRPYSAIFWVGATTQGRAEGSFRSIWERIKSQTEYLPDINAKATFVLRMFTSWTVQWLMVFDNYDNPDIYFPEIRDFTVGYREFWPTSFFIIELQNFENQKSEIKNQQLVPQLQHNIQNSRPKHTPHATNSAPAMTNSRRDSSAQLTCWEVKVLLHVSRLLSDLLRSQSSSLQCAPVARPNKIRKNSWKTPKSSILIEFRSILPF